MEILGEGRARAVPKKDKKAIALILQKKLVKEGGGNIGGDNARRGQIPLKDGGLESDRYGRYITIQRDPSSLGYCQSSVIAG